MRTSNNEQEMSDEYKAAQARLMLEQASDVDVIITTALIPGRKAPVLVNQGMLDVMKPGSVIVDLAAANGGNVAQTEANKVRQDEAPRCIERQHKVYSISRVQTDPLLFRSLQPITASRSSGTLTCRPGSRVLRAHW